jgi:hypothetical protein
MEPASLPKTAEDKIVVPETTGVATKRRKTHRGIRSGRKIRKRRANARAIVDLLIWHDLLSSVQIEVARNAIDNLDLLTWQGVLSRVSVEVARDTIDVLDLLTWQEKALRIQAVVLKDTIDILELLVWHGQKISTLRENGTETSFPTLLMTRIDDHQRPRPYLNRQLHR